MMSVFIALVCVVVFLFQPDWALDAKDPSYLDMVLCQFVHLNWYHLFCNLSVLVPFGYLFERDVPGWLGRLGLLAIFLGAGTMGIAMESLAHPEYSGKILGASAACAGLVGVSISNWRRGLIASPILLSFLWGFFEGTPQVAHIAHISGAIIGLSCSTAIFSTTRQPT